MKRLTTYMAYLLVAAASFTACSLDEDNKSAINSKTYFQGEAEYEQLVAESYVIMRPLLRVTIPMWYGTDMYECQGDPDISDARTPANDYTVVGGDEFLDFWNNCYDLISKVNTALTRGADIAKVSDDLRALRTAEMKALRAYAYFNLVENFGGVPVVTKEVAEPVYSFNRESEETVYSQILTDLTEALVVPDQPAEFGRVSKGFVYHLFAKVYLTRSYKSFGNKTEDLKNAVSYAEKALALHPLLTGNEAWNTLFDTYSTNRYTPNSSEVIFSVRYANSTDQTFNGGWGNNLYQHFKFVMDQIPGRSTKVGPYWRHDLTYQPTNFYFGLFDNTDVRASEIFMKRSVIAAEDDADDPGIKQGNEVIYFPRTAMSDAEKAQYKADHPSVRFIVNPDSYHKYLEGKNFSAFPLVWKFWDPWVARYTADKQNPEGSRDTYVYRSAETLLLLAEAYVQQGKGGDATELINRLRNRAGAPTLTTDATIDDVLDESARELFGEANRWMDLKRTGKLFDRAWEHNVWVKKQHTTANSISSNFLLRPIPITEIAYSGGSLKQNPGYPGAE